MKLFPELNADTHVVTVDRMPEWVMSSDAVIGYNPKWNTLVIRSQTQYERRWRRWWHWLKRMVVRW